ncbi:MAG: hypothetical protein R2857_02860 [Vampirovibrionales bacterium]
MRKRGVYPAYGLDTGGRDTSGFDTGNPPSPFWVLRPVPPGGQTPQGIGEEGDQRAVVNQFCADLFAREGDDLPFPRATDWLTPPPESGAFADVLVVSGVMT